MTADGGGSVAMLVDAAAAALAAQAVGQVSIKPKAEGRENRLTPGAIKSHVSRACNNCKHAHLACDSSRPCRRCVSLAKADTCSDMEHRRRGRPRRRVSDEDKSAEITFTPAPVSARAARRAAGTLVVLTSNLETATGKSCADSTVSSPSSCSPTASSESLVRVPSSPVRFASPAPSFDAALVPTANPAAARLPSDTTAALCTCTTSGRVCHMTAGAMQLFGLSTPAHQQRVIGIAIHSLIHEHDHAQFEAAWQAAGSGSPRTCALHLLTLHRGVALFTVEVTRDVSTQAVVLALSPFKHRGLDEFPVCIESTLPRLHCAPLSQC